MKSSPLQISNITIQPGERITVALPTPELYTCAPMYIPIHITHGRKAGPVLLICGSIHGDEINGVAITQKLLNLRLLKNIRGTLIVIPSINIYGMITLSRNLPDRRDLEGSFPGSQSGSFASRLAHLLTEEVFSRITHCIDLHTGEPHITKFPQVRTLTGHADARKLAHHFQPPVIVNASADEGLLWLQDREENPIPTIIYETGEANRLDEYGIRLGVKGIVRVMRNLEMLKTKFQPAQIRYPVQIEDEYWIRASSSGLCETPFRVGTFVKRKTAIARITDPFGTQQREEVYAPFDGIIIGKNNLPILNEGEPILHLAQVLEENAERIQEWSEEKNTRKEID